MYWLCKSRVFANQRILVFAKPFDFHARSYYNLSGSGWSWQRIAKWQRSPAQLAISKKTFQMKLTAKERLRRFYNCFSGGDRVLVVINADPDSIACALAVKRLLWRRVAGISVSNINVITRPDNIAMINLLNVKMIYVEDVDFKTFDRFVIVDSQPNHNKAFSYFSPDAIIDHHPDTKPDAPFVDIRPEYGANASIMTEYIRAARIKPSAKLATGLLHAIKTDTSNFERKTIIEDIRAFQFVFRHANIHLAGKIEQADLRLDFLKYFRAALDDLQMRGGRAFIHLGPVKSPDICVLVAEFLMRIHSVKWSIVSGIYKETAIVIFRNDGIRKNAGKTAEKFFGGIGSAGGHKSAARAEIPIEEIRRLIGGNSLRKWIIDRFEKSCKKCNKTFKKEIVGL